MYNYRTQFTTSACTYINFLILYIHNQTIVINSRCTLSSHIPHCTKYTCNTILIPKVSMLHIVQHDRNM